MQEPNAGTGEGELVHAANLLRAGSPSEVMSRLSDGDPLRVADRCSAVIDERAALVSLPRLIEKAIARIAFDARRYRSSESLERWLAERIGRALDDLLEEDQEEQALGLALDGADDPRYAFLASALGVELGIARRMCVAFHDLPLPSRRVFFECVIHRRSFADAAASLATDPERVRKLLKDTLVHLMTLGRRPRPTSDGEFEHES